MLLIDGLEEEVMGPFWTRLAEMCDMDVGTRRTGSWCVARTELKNTGPELKEGRVVE